MSTYEPNPDLPELARAASLALALLRATKTQSWAELVAEPSRLVGLEVDTDQVELLNRHRDALALLRATPATALSVCPVCGKFTVVTGTAAKKCPLTLGCPGEPVKASAATKPQDPTEPPTETDLEPEPEPGDEGPRFEVTVLVAVEETR